MGVAKLKSRRLSRAVALTTTAMLVSAVSARADDYKDLLDLLRAKGTLSQGEYETLLAKHVKNAHAPEGKRARVARAPRQETVPAQATSPTQDAEDAAARARQDAAAAAASAAAAKTAAQTTKTAILDSPDLVHVLPYVPGNGISLQAGQFNINISGFVNGYYTFASVLDHGPGAVVAGGLAEATGFDESAVRNGLLPAAIKFKAATKQEGIDLSFEFGVYPGLNSAQSGALGANSGGSPVGLGTSGIDFRQIFGTAGTPEFGTMKIGRDIGVFGSEAILNDQTLFGVGGPGNNANPANTSQGRIGLGYIYADWLPQITYTSPNLDGLQVKLAAVTPLDEFAFAGPSFSSTSTAHSTPMFQTEITYDYKVGDWATRLWAGALVQPQQNVLNPQGVRVADTTAAAGEAGVKLTKDPFGLVGYYYRGSGVGTTALFFDGIAANGKARDSDGWYVQASVKPLPELLPKLKLVGSFGTSNLDQAPGEHNPTLVSHNEAYIGGAYYQLTDWLTLVGEYAHVRALSHGPNQANEDSYTVGGIIFY
jgi:predicted porin